MVHLLQFVFVFVIRPSLRENGSQAWESQRPLSQAWGTAREFLRYWKSVNPRLRSKNRRHIPGSVSFQVEVSMISKFFVTSILFDFNYVTDMLLGQFYLVIYERSVEFGLSSGPNGSVATLTGGCHVVPVMSFSQSVSNFDPASTFVSVLSEKSCSPNFFRAVATYSNVLHPKYEGDVSKHSEKEFDRSRTANAPFWNSSTIFGVCISKASLDYCQRRFFYSMQMMGRSY